MAADAAGDEKLGALLRGTLRDVFRIRFHGKALHGLKGGGNGFLVWFWPPHFRIEPLIDLTQRGIARADAWHHFGILRCGGAG